MLEIWQAHEIISIYQEKKAHKLQLRFKEFCSNDSFPRIHTYQYEQGTIKKIKNVRMYCNV